MVKKISKSAQLKNKLNKAIINTIVSMGGGASRKDIISAIEKSKNFNTWESEVLGSNKKRWLSLLDIESNELVKSGRIIKQKGFWVIIEDEIQQLKGSQFEDLLLDLSEPYWMKIIRGKENPESNDMEANEAKMLRNAFLKYERKKEIESIDTDKKFEEFHKTLIDIRSSEPAKDTTLKNMSWWALIKAALILISGLIIGIMMPMQLATRGGHDSSFFDRFKGSNQNEQISIRLTLKDKAPLSLAEDIIFTAVDSKVEVKVLNNNELHLLIYGLKPLDESQFSLKVMLGLGDEAAGNAEVVILKNE